MKSHRSGSKDVLEVPREGNCKADWVEEKASTSMAGSGATEKRSAEEATVGSIAKLPGELNMAASSQPREIRI